MKCQTGIRSFIGTARPWIVILLVVGTAGVAMGIGAAPRYVEELCVGGGYGETVDGGVDVEQDGDILTDGDVTVGGSIRVDGNEVKNSDGETVLEFDAAQNVTVPATISVNGDTTLGDGIGDVFRTMAVVGLNGTHSPTRLMSASHPANYVVNGSFESWLAGTNTAADGWVPLGTPTLSRSTDAKWSDYSQKISTSVSHHGMSSDNLSVKPGTDYTWAIWVKDDATSGIGSIRLSVRDITNSSYLVFVDEDITTSWAQYFVTFTTTSTTETISIRPNGGEQTGDFYVDGCMLVEGNAAFAYAGRPIVSTGAQPVYAALGFKTDVSLDSDSAGLCFGDEQDFRLGYELSGSDHFWKVEDGVGNDMLTVKDGGTVGDVSVTGELAVSGAAALNGQLNYTNSGVILLDGTNPTPVDFTDEGGVDMDDATYAVLLAVEGSSSPLAVTWANRSTTGFDIYAWNVSNGTESTNHTLGVSWLVADQ